MADLFWYQAISRTDVRVERINPFACLEHQHSIGALEGKAGYIEQNEGGIEWSVRTYPFEVAVHRNLYRLTELVHNKTLGQQTAGSGIGWRQ